jgi:hypothetical protein
LGEILVDAAAGKLRVELAIVPRMSDAADRIAARSLP